MQMLPRTLPRNLDDLTVQVALVRPGPIQGGAVHPYIERRERAARGSRLRGPLRAPVAGAGAEGHAGGDRLPGAGDRGGDGAVGLRRRRGGGAAPGDEPQALRGGDPAPTTSASSRARSSAASAPSVAERVFEQIEGFSGFGFPKAHAAAFGLLAYQSTWLRVHYGPEFLCSLLNEQPMGFYPPDALVHEAQRRGIEVLPAGRQPQPRALPRRARRTLAVRIGLGYVNGIARRRPRRWSPSASAAAPIAASPTLRRARAPGATGWSGSPGPAPATMPEARDGAQRRALAARNVTRQPARRAARRPALAAARAGRRRPRCASWALGAAAGRLRRRPG